MVSDLSMRLFLSCIPTQLHRMNICQRFGRVILHVVCQRLIRIAVHYLLCLFLCQKRLTIAFYSQQSIIELAAKIVNLLFRICHDSLFELQCKDKANKLIYKIFCMLFYCRSLYLTFPPLKTTATTINDDGDGLSCAFGLQGVSPLNQQRHAKQPSEGLHHAHHGHAWRLRSDEPVVRRRHGGLGGVAHGFRIQHGHPHSGHR